MFERDIFLNISPLDHRYYLANRGLFDKLSNYLSERANVQYCIKAELSLLRNIIEITHQDEDTTILDGLEKRITPEEVYREEEKTRHNVRALVNVIKKYVPEKWANFVHLGATSVDILDTATAMSYRDTVREVLLPTLISLEEKLIDIARRESNTPQIGRTHGQHAVPITFGFAISEYVSRLGKSIHRIYQYSKDLRGKLSGAVGAYNATALIVDDPLALEEAYLSSLGLRADDISTQLVQPEYSLRLLLEINIAFGIIANLADDLRNLQRTEIGEVREGFGKHQVGSSTMPQKRNPWNSEHIKSMWKTFSPRTITFFMDQISEHQRDLTNSASRRFIADFITGFLAAASRMIRVLEGLRIDREKMLKNLLENGDLVLSEAVYILLATMGEREGHEIVRKLTLKREKTGKRLWELIQANRELNEMLTRALKKLGVENSSLFWRKPEFYSGIASKKVNDIVSRYEALVENIKKEIEREGETN